MRQREGQIRRARNRSLSAAKGDAQDGKNACGRSRYLARTVLKNLYPPEFQDRPPGNDVIDPD